MTSPLPDSLPMTKTDWITFTNANPYRSNLRVRLRRDMIAGYEENAEMQYGYANQPEGTKQKTFIYTVGGNQIMVGETIEQIDQLLGFLNVD